MPTPWEYALLSQGMNRWPNPEQVGGGSPLDYGRGLNYPSQQPAARGVSPFATQSPAQQIESRFGPQARGATGGTANPQQLGRQPAPARGTQGGGGLPFSLPSGGVYGQNKWMPGPATDVFLPRGSPVTATQGGQVLQTYMGGLTVKFDNGVTVRFSHAPAAVGQGQRFAAGAVLARVGDPSMDMLTQQFGQAVAGYPDGYQHVQISASTTGDPGAWTSPQGGNIDVDDALASAGYQGRRVGQTPGPMGGGGGGGFPGGPGGFPGGPSPFGMPGGGGFPGGPSPFGPPGGAGFPGASPFGFNPFQGGGGGFRPPMGPPMMPQMMPQPMMPPMRPMGPPMMPFPQSGQSMLGPFTGNPFGGFNAMGPMGSMASRGGAIFPGGGPGGTGPGGFGMVSPYGGGGGFGAGPGAMGLGGIFR